jgi:hypothetical protein
METPARHQPCLLLQEAGVPCVVWFEDALHHYGVPIVVFDLYLLVPDINQAAQVLLHKGWTHATAQPSSDMNFLARHPEIEHRRLNPPGGDPGGQPLPWPPPLPGELRPSPVTTVLLPAADWKFPAEKLAAASLNGFSPPLPALTDALIERLLDSPHGSRLQGHVALQICYLYGHVRELRERSVAEELINENRQFHNDALYGMDIGTLPVLAHERQVRDELRNGKRRLEECSVPCIPENAHLFDSGLGGPGSA